MAEDEADESAADRADDDAQWWYNTRTKQVEHGAKSPWSDRAGPYRTREEAEGAPGRLAENSANWDDD